MEEGSWKVSEILPVENPRKLVECGYEFSSDFAKAIDVMDARQDGYFVNYEGEAFASIQADYKNKGAFKQEGARWLYENGKATTYKALLKDYYDSSSASTGGAIRFFDNHKNEL